MDASRWLQARSLFDALAEMPATEWVEELERCCPHDPIVRSIALDLLRADIDAAHAETAVVAHAPDLLENFATEETERAISRWIGRQIGAWRIVSTLGRGGMGMVYLAERADGEFRQKAAIKILHGAGEADIERFLMERQILAELQHRNIARLLDGGSCEEAGPWLALEYIEGTPLTEWCDHRSLGLRERLGIFLDVCAAVSYAHEHLIVHRDLKPANILVDGDGQVKLLDFGIAKLLDESHSGEAHTAFRVFTPEYAAPEQVRGERVTTAADVYSLGVVLFELLAGTRPYRNTGDSPRAQEQAVLEQQPARLSQAVTQDIGLARPIDSKIAARRGIRTEALKRALRGDLDAITARALRKEANARYPSVQALAADVRAHLAGRPVVARRGGARYRANRFLRRNVLAVSLVALTVLGLTTGLLIALWQGAEARKQRDTAQASLHFMSGLFANADPGLRSSATITLEDVLATGARDIRTAFDAHDPVRSTLLLAIGSAYNSAYKPDLADDLLSEAASIALHNGNIAEWLEAESLRCEMIVEKRAPHCDTLTQQAIRELDLEDPYQLRAFAGVFMRQAEFLNRTSRFDESVEHVRTALASLRARPETLRQRSELIGTLSFALVELGRSSEAVSALEPLIEELRTTDSTPPRVLADALDNLASAEGALGDTERAIQLRKESLDVMVALYGADNPVIATKTGNLSMSLYRAGQLDEAMAYAERELALKRSSSYLRAHPSFVGTLSDAGAIALQLGRLNEAIALFDEAIALGEQIAPQGRHLGIAHWWRAAAWFADAQLSKAEQDLAKHWLMFASTNAPDHPRLLRNRAMAIAIEVTRNGWSSLSPVACAEIASFRQVYERSEPGLVSPAEIAFGDFLADLCAGTGATERPAAGLEALTRFKTKVPATEIRLRHAERVVAALRSSAGRDLQ